MDGHEHQPLTDEAQLFWQLFDRRPQMLRALPCFYHLVGRVRCRAGLETIPSRPGVLVQDLSRTAPSVGSLPIECHPPRHLHEPGTEPFPIAQLPEAAKRLRERFLRDVFGIFTLAKHAERDPEGQSGGIDQPRLELALQLLVKCHKAARKAFGALMHLASPWQDGTEAPPVHLAAPQKAQSSRVKVGK